MKLPVYAPIPSLHLNRQRLVQEIEERCLIEAFERSVVFRSGKSVYDDSVDLNIATPEDLNQTTYYLEGDGGTRQTVPGQYSTYRVLNLTRLPENPDTNWLTYIERRGVRVMFWHFYKKPWQWMPQMQNSYLRQVLESLPFEYIQAVRLVSMVPPAIGQVHVDAAKKANALWLAKGFASITLNLSHGGTFMKFSVGKNVHQADPEVQVSHFNDAYHHGVPRLTSVRHQIRVFGKMATADYVKLMDLDRAVWDAEDFLGESAELS